MTHSGQWNADTPVLGPTSRDERTVGVSLRLGSHVGPSEVEEELDRYPDLTGAPDVVYVDLSAAVSFDVAGLLRLIAMIAERHSGGLQTRLKLPDNELARHVLRVWRFPDALSAAVMTPFRLMVDADDWVYFGEQWPPLHVRADASSPRASVLAYLVERRLFGMTTYRSRAVPELDQMVDREIGRWSGYALSSLLDRVLRGPATEVARVVIRELLENVVQHSDPSVAVVSSQLDLVAQPAMDLLPGLTLAVWADGKSIISTLRDHLASTTGEPRAAVACGDTPSDLSWVTELHGLARFEVTASGWSPSRTVYDAGWVPAADMPDPEILLASLVPGVTRKEQLPAPAGPPYRLRARGYGLFALCRAVVDTFGGSVEVHSERSLLRIDRPAAHGAYRVHLTAEPRQPRLRGDLVTIRLPVRND